MANKDLVISIPYRKYVVIREALERGGNNFDEQLQRKAEEWYQALIPKEQREEIEKQIQADNEAEELRKKMFAVVRIQNGFESYAFTTERGEEFYSIARDFVDLDAEKDLEQYELDSISRNGFRHASFLDEPVYEIICGAIKNNQSISAVVNFDLEDRNVCVLEQGSDDWKTYSLDTMEKAVKSLREFAAEPYAMQRSRFHSLLESEEIEMDEGQALTQ